MQPLLLLLQGAEQLLPVLDDRELFTDQHPFRTDELALLAAFCNRTAFRLTWEQPADGAAAIPHGASAPLARARPAAHGVLRGGMLGTARKAVFRVSGTACVQQGLVQLHQHVIYQRSRGLVVLEPPRGRPVALLHRRKECNHGSRT